MRPSATVRPPASRRPSTGAQVASQSRTSAASRSSTGSRSAVDARALIPRPETERLVELAELEVVRRLVSAPRATGAPPIRFLDVGVGSGAVAVTIAVLLRRRRMLDEVEIRASDISDDALQLAKENAVAHAVGDRIDFATADLIPGDDTGQWDVIAANLPYVKKDAIPGLPRAASFEPAIALDGGPDGLRIIARLLDQLPAALAPDGVALIEIGGDQGQAMLDLAAERLAGWSCELEKDLGGLPRVAVLRRAPDGPAGLMPTRRLVDGPEARDEAARILADGGIVAVPTDTVYGIAVALETPGGIERLFAAKSRPPDKAIALLLADADQSTDIGELSAPAMALAREFWPGGLTLVVRRRGDRPLPAALTGSAAGRRRDGRAARAGPPAAARAGDCGRATADDIRQSIGRARVPNGRRDRGAPG